MLSAAFAFTLPSTLPCPLLPPLTISYQTETTLIFLLSHSHSHLSCQYPLVIIPFSLSSIQSASLLYSDSESEREPEPETTTTLRQPPLPKPPRNPLPRPPLLRPLYAAVWIVCFRLSPLTLSEPYSTLPSIHRFSGSSVPISGVGTLFFVLSCSKRTFRKSSCKPGPPPQNVQSTAALSLPSPS